MVVTWHGTIRRPQQACECPERFRGSQRYVAASACRLPTVMPFGKHRGTRFDALPEGYLRWVVRNFSVSDVRDAAVAELNRRRQRHERQSAVAD